MASNKLIRFVVTVDEETYKALVRYQVDNKLTRDNALKAIIKKYLMQSGDDVTPIPAPEPSPNTYDVDVKVVGGNVRVMAGSRVLAMVPSGSDMSWALRLRLMRCPRMER